MHVEQFLMDAIKLSALQFLDNEDRFTHVLSLPLRVSNQDSDEYALLVDKPIALDIEMGRSGKSHLRCIQAMLKELSTAGVYPDHLRTDGNSAWVVSIT